MDPSGQTQGPFPARNMLEWYRRGLLNDMSLQTCGAVSAYRPKLPNCNNNSDVIQQSLLQLSLLHVRSQPLWVLSSTLPCACQAHLQAYASSAFSQKAFQHQIVPSHNQTSCQDRLRDAQSMESISMPDVVVCACRRERWPLQTSRSRSTTGLWGRCCRASRGASASTLSPSLTSAQARSVPASISSSHLILSETNGIRLLIGKPVCILNCCTAWLSLHATVHLATYLKCLFVIQHWDGKGPTWYHH